MSEKPLYEKLGMSQKEFDRIYIDTLAKLGVLGYIPLRSDAGKYLLSTVLGLDEKQITKELLVKAIVIADTIVAFYDKIVSNKEPVPYLIPLSAVAGELHKEKTEDNGMYG